MAEHFDAKAAYAALSPDDQRDIGETAVLLFYTQDVLANLPIEQAASTQPFEVAHEEMRDRLIAIFSLADIPGWAADPPLKPDLSVFDITACRVCGCTEERACPGGCSWSEPDLCSQCEGKDA